MMRAPTHILPPRWTFLAVLVAILTVLPGGLAAQHVTGEIHGVVVDSAGKALPGAIVRVTNVATKAALEVAADSQGRFAAPSLAAGPYEVIATQKRFAARRQNDLVVHVGEAIALRFELPLAVLPETIAINNRPTVVESSRSHTSDLVSEAAITYLPVVSRNVLDLALLTPTLTRAANGGMSAAGQINTLNHVSVDGADIDDGLFGSAGIRGRGGVAPYRYSEAAVLEFRVDSSGYPASSGPAGGVVLDALTRSGSNRMQGSLFEHFRDSGLNATPVTTDTPVLPNGPGGANQFGGALGGPIARDRHFFFVSYDGLRSSDTNHLFLNLPPQLPADALTARAIATLDAAAHSWERTVDQDLFLARTDHQLTPGHRLTLRYDQLRYDGDGAMNSGPQQAFETTGLSTVDTRTFVAGDNGVLRRSVVNELRVHYANDRQSDLANSTAPQADVRQDGTLVLRIGGNAFSPRESRLNRWQITDSLTAARGGHTVRAGIDLEFNRITLDAPANASGAYVFETLASFAGGRPVGSGDAFTQAFASGGTAGFTTHPDSADYGVFVQDQWQVTPATTINAGLRYDVQSFDQLPIRNDDPRLTAAGIDTSVLTTDTNNWGPRIGVAWSPGERRYVARAAYGITYGRTPAAAVAAAANNGINARTLTFRGVAGEPVPTYPDRFTTMPTGATAPRPTIFVFDPAFAQPRVQQASAGLEWEWMPNVSLSVDFLHSSRNQLPRSTDLNVSAAPPVMFTVADTGVGVPYEQVGAGPFPNFARVVAYQSSAESRYDGITFQLHRRFAQGFHYRVAYTVSELQDTMPDATALVPESVDDRRFAANPLDFEASRAPGNNDRRHRLTASTIYDTTQVAKRFGAFEPVLTRWTLSAIWIIESGAPYSAYVSTDINGDRNRYNDIAPGTARNQYRMPATISIDPRAARRFGLPGGRELTLSIEAFNIRNRPNYTAVNDTLYTVSGTTLRTNPLFGQKLAPAGPRTAQLSARFSF